ncbi:TIGR00153 family protein [Chlamydiifrater phoenicopteri]|uniref:TIGR00153 family protein n=1 Tax=Chlamydiifrater phoenicopteri TaxID=2681469 RepID=UPI001BCDA6A8|nr:TIGR00153 family protein [Chlamydiifrater phoenicopteri]
MQTLARLFGQSPFEPLQAHLEVVVECVSLLPEIFVAVRDKKYLKVEEIAQDISKKEFQADCIKNDMRNHLPMGIFTPVSRVGLLEIISIQDSIADTAEDVGILLTIKQLHFHKDFEELFFNFLEKNLEAFGIAATLIQEFNQLLESSFGGRKADKAREYVRDVAKAEHQADVLQRSLMKVFFHDDLVISEKQLYLWLQVIKRTAGVSNASEKLANRINMTLEDK